MSKRREVNQKRAVWDRFSDLDLFPKVNLEYKKSTSAGGAFSILVSLAVFLIVLHGTHDYLRYRQSHKFVIAGAINHNLQINLDLTVATSCADIRIDVLDKTGLSENLGHQLKKEEVIFSLKDAENLSVKRYEEEHVHDILRNSNKRSDYTLGAQHQGNQAGCRLFGHVIVKQVSGLFHITAHGHGHGGAHTPHESMNFTHRVDDFSFGTHYPKMINPLDNTYGLTQHNFASFRYIVNVVPTRYIGLSGSVLDTNQYAVNGYRKEGQEADLGNGFVPGIFFSFRVDPISLQVTETKPSLIGILIKTFTAIGGLLFISRQFYFKIIGEVGEKQRPRRRSFTEGLILDPSCSKSDVAAPVSANTKPDE